MKKEPKEEKQEAAELQEQINKLLIPMLAVIEQKMESRMKAEMAPVSEEFSKVDRALSCMDDDLKVLKDMRRLESVEKSCNELRRDLGAFQNRMFGMDAMPERVGKMELDQAQMLEKLKAMAPKLEEMSDLNKRLDALDAGLAKGLDELPAMHNACAERAKGAKERADLMEKSHKEMMAGIEQAYKDLREAVALDVKGLMNDQAELKEKSFNRADGLEREHKNAKRELDASVSRFEQLYNDLKRGLLEKVEAQKDMVADCMNRIDFAEMQGRRMNRLEKSAEQHDQMLKELYKQLKEL